MTPSLTPQNLVNNLMNMYNSNIRQIENLQQANIGIRNDITTILLRTINMMPTNVAPINVSPINVAPINVSPINAHTNAHTNAHRRIRSQDNNITNTMNTLFQNFLEPIQVFPTSAQIENAVRIARFSDIVRPINNSCPITMDRFNENDNVSIIRYCNHIFNTDSLNNWFIGNCRCPVCRYDIRNYNNTSTNSTNVNTNTNANAINANTTATIPNISNVQYDALSDSVMFDINNDDFYNTITRIALNSLYGINNVDASGNVIIDASGNIIRDPSGNIIRDPPIN